MELVTGIEWRDGKAVANCINECGGARTIAPSELPTQGLPAGRYSGRTITAKLRDMQVASFEEYASAFGIPFNSGFRHSTWSLQLAQSRLVIPALTLLRAFIRPGRTLFPTLFKAQSLDDICLFSGGNENCFITPTRSLGNHLVSRSMTIMQPLSWFYCFPSARTAWSSVYQASKLGNLHFQLPEAEVKFSFYSKSVRGNNYVTAISLSRIEALEAPSEFAPGHPRTIFTSARAEGFELEAPNKQLVPNFAELTDDEWHSVSPLLAAQRDPFADTFPRRRTILNGVLRKLSTSMTWPQIESEYGISEGALSTSCSRWMRDGRMKKVLARLNEMRETRGA